MMNRFVSVLKSEFKKREEKNPRYSLRAFSKHLEIDHSTLSRILRGERKMNTQQIEKVGAKLGLSRKEIRSHIKNDQASSLSKFEKELSTNLYPLIDDELVQVISEWYYFPILELLAIPSFKFSPIAVRKALGLTLRESKDAISMLSRMKMIGLDSKGKYIDLTSGSSTTIKDPKKSSAAHRAFQKAMLQKSIEALDQVDPSLRSQTGMTIAIDPSRIDEAREHIRVFQRKIVSLLAEGEKKQVYHLSVSLFPVSGI